MIRKLGTIDLDMVETTPVVFDDKLWRFEYVREGYRANDAGTSYFRFLDVKSGRPTEPFAHGYHLGSAYAEGDSVYAYGTNAWGGEEVRVFQSHDLYEWEGRTALSLPGWRAYNTSVCRGGDRYVMAIELGEPEELVGRRFTMFFAVSEDLVAWSMLPPDRVYSREKYTACPALRYLSGHFYMIYLEARSGPTYEPHVVRSRDLIHWEASPFNPVMRHSDEDKRIANDRLTNDERDRICKAVNINNSDVDLCEFRGETVIYYSWGNQQGTEFLAEALYDGTLEEFFREFFPEKG